MDKAPYVDGNRLPVDLGGDNRHFFYKAKTPAYEASDAELVVQAVHKYCETYGELDPSQVDLLGANQIEALVPGSGSALKRMFAAFDVSDEIISDLSVLYCRWAQPHVDDALSGKALVSLVLSTGPEPYVMSTFNSYVGTRYDKPAQFMSTTTRLLKVGDVVVFDPTTPHMVMPRLPRDGQMLILLQFHVSDETPKERAKLLRSIPQMDDDCDLCRLQ